MHKPVGREIGGGTVKGAPGMVAGVGGGWVGEGTGKGGFLGSRFFR